MRRIEPGLSVGDKQFIGLLIVSRLFVAGLRLTFLTSTYPDFVFTLLVFSIIVDICTARPTRVVVGLALNTVM